MRKTEIKVQDILAGWLSQDENGYHFEYDADYLNTGFPEPESKALPLHSMAGKGK